MYVIKPKEKLYGRNLKRLYRSVFHGNLPADWRYRPAVACFTDEELALTMTQIYSTEYVRYDFNPEAGQ